MARLDWFCLETDKSVYIGQLNRLRVKGEISGFGRLLAGSGLANRANASHRFASASSQMLAIATPTYRITKKDVNWLRGR